VEARPKCPKKPTRRLPEDGSRTDGARIERTLRKARPLDEAIGARVSTPR
jgi:hypothetical protein